MLNVHQYSANSFDEFIRIITVIDAMHKSPGINQTYWYRGHGSCDWNLLPGVFRKNEGFLAANEDLTYSAKHLQEDYLYQHFRARAQRQINDKIDHKIEWSEVMQHFAGTTRLMDWSESAIVSLIFALEPFLDPDNDLDLKQKRRYLTPSVWILMPSVLNSIVYDALLEKDIHGCYYLIKKALSDLADKSEQCFLAQNIGRELEMHKEKYLSSASKCLVSMSGIEADRVANSYRLKELLSHYSFNPFFYLLARYYADGLFTPEGNLLPPLAIVHPYHSDRISAQRGVFTITPYNLLSEKQKQEYKLGNNIMAMERMELIDRCLYEVRIINAQQIARELRLSGHKRSWIYPDLENYTKEIEHI
jgi:hypothetical protein